MVRRPEPAVAVEDENFFFKVSKASFTHRRKTLWNNLTGYFGKTEEVKGQADQGFWSKAFCHQVRGEALSLTEFASLSGCNLKSKDSKMQGQIIKALVGFYYVRVMARSIKHARVGISVKKAIPLRWRLGRFFCRGKIQKAISSRFMNGKTVWSVRLLSILTKLW